MKKFFRIAIIFICLLFLCKTNIINADSLYNSSNCDGSCPSSYTCEPTATQNAGQIQYQCVAPNSNSNGASSSDCLKMYFGLPISGMQQGDCVSYDAGVTNFIQTSIKFVFGSIGTIAVIILIVAGFMMAFAAGNQKTIKQAKEMMENSVIGLIVVIFSGSILAIVNPDLVSVNTYTMKLPTNIEVVPKMDVEKLLNKTNMPDGFGDPNLSAIIQKVATERHADYCALYTLAYKESHGTVYAIGHDEKVNVTQSYTNFCSSRTYYKGGIFSSADSSNCNSNKNVTNDDEVNTSDTNNLGLDWRYSHGIGMMQITIFPGNSSSFQGVGERNPSSPYYILINGKKYYAKNLFDPETSLNAAVDLLISKGFGYLTGSDVNGMTDAQLKSMFVAYNGAGPAAEQYGNEAIIYYKDCKNNLNTR